MVPPEGFAVNVIDWPLSIVGEDGVMIPATKAELTVTATAFEVETSAGEALSVTWSSNDHEPVIVSTPVELVGSSPALHGNELPSGL
jgi:hypothetical protein